jgi:hypothetical protein
MSDSIDAHLLAKLTPFLITDYEKLQYNKKFGLRRDFISGKINEFELTYNEPQKIDYIEAFNSLDKVGEEVLCAESVVCRAYLSKIHEVKNRYLLLQASSRKDDKTFFEQSEVIYGLPKLQYYQYAMRGLRKTLENIEALQLADNRVRNAVDMLSPLQVEKTPTSWDSILLPDYVDDKDNHILTSAEVKVMCEAAFVEYGIDGWKVIVANNGDRITFNVNQEERVLYIPHDEDIRLRKYPLTLIRMEALIAHEIGTHVVRRQNGDNSSLALLGPGLADYLNGEEGIATYREQLVRGASQFAGIMGYLSVSWAVGLDGKPRNFRELFEIMVPYLFLSVIEQTSKSKLPLDLDSIDENVRRNAWARCVRTFRGVTGLNKGYCFTRDIIYLEGNIAIWQLLEAEPTASRNFSIGKYDPTNKEHVSILHELGLLK